MLTAAEAMPIQRSEWPRLASLLNTLPAVLGHLFDIDIGLVETVEENNGCGSVGIELVDESHGVGQVVAQFHDDGYVDRLFDVAQNVDVALLELPQV